MTHIALIGAGGKMGVRLAANLGKSVYSVDHVENAPAGQDRLSQVVGVSCVEMDDALGRADAVILAVPDNLIGTIAHGIVDKVRPGTAIIILDAAAPYAGMLPERDTLTYFVTHPCHPSTFSNETDSQARKDFFGGVAAKQAIVCALVQGPENHYATCEDIAKTIFRPVTRSHRCTLEQIAILEPALSETVGATLCLALRDATDEAVRRGVPRDAAMDFMLGHISIELAIAFGIFSEGKFSDGALKAIEEAKPMIFKDGWLDRVFAEEEVMRSVRSICEPRRAA